MRETTQFTSRRAAGHGSSLAECRVHGLGKSCKADGAAAIVRNWSVSGCPIVLSSTRSSYNWLHSVFITKPVFSRAPFCYRTDGSQSSVLPRFNCNRILISPVTGARQTPAEGKINKHELKANFDQQAAGYDQRWARMAPILNGLHYLLQSQFAGLPEDAHILCVGVGTGAELVHLAQVFPAWRFTVVEPSGGMLDVCRQQADKEGLTERCTFHEGYLDSFPAGNLHDAATCFLVSQFILEQKARSAFFHEIATRLKPGGLLASSDLAADTSSRQYDTLLRAWMNMMFAADFSDEQLERMRATYANDVAVIPAQTIASIIAAGGFESPVQFFQAGLIHGWVSKRI